MDAAVKLQHGTGSLRTEKVAGLSSVTQARANYPLKFLTPRCRGRAAWTYLSTMGGGLVDGDRVEVTIRVTSQATSFVGTQASTKVYRAPSGKGCRQDLRAILDDDATLVLLPDPVTCFADSRYEQIQRFDLHESSNLVLLDWVTSGRWCSGERWDFSRYSSRTEVFVGGEPRVVDSVVLDPRDGDLKAMFRMGEFNCLAFVVVIGAQLETLTQSALESIGNQRVGGSFRVIESISPIVGGAVLRVLGMNVECVGEVLRERLAAVTAILGESPLQRKW